jgi:hypothetical protein
LDSRAAKVWSDVDAPAVCLLALGVDRYGVGAVNWTPETWAHEIKDDAGVALPQRNSDKLSAACVMLVHAHEFRRSPATFNDVVCGLAAEWFDTGVWHPPTAQECAWGLVEAHLLNPPDKGEEFSPEVVRYVNMLVRNDGFKSLPRVFRTFGIPEDASLPPPHDYSGDPDLAAADAEGTQALEQDLGSWLAEKMGDLAERLLVLPLHNPGDVRDVVEQLRRAAA